MRKPISALAALVVVTLVFVGAPADAASRYSVTVAVSAARADVGQSVSLTGKVKPGASGERVKVQRLAGTTWTTVGRARLNRHSRYSVSVSVTAAGDNSYRVVKPRSDGHKAGVSPIVTVVGWRWRPISGMPTYGLISNATVLPSGLLGPTSFSPLIKLGSPSAGSGSITYVLDYQCTAFDAHVAMTPDSFASNAATANLGSVTPQGSVTQIGQIRELWPGWDPVHVLRSAGVISQVWGLNLQAQDMIGGGYVGWGAAMVYCRS